MAYMLLQRTSTCFTRLRTLVGSASRSLRCTTSESTISSGPGWSDDSVASSSSTELTSALAKSFFYRLSSSRTTTWHLLKSPACFGEVPISFTNPFTFWKKGYKSCTASRPARTELWIQCRMQGTQKQPSIKPTPFYMFAALSVVITGWKSVAFNVFSRMVVKTTAMFSPVWWGSSKGTEPRL